MDLNEIMNRAKAAQAQALESLEKMEEKADALADAASPRQDAAVQEDARQAQAAAEAAQAAANQARQVEVLGQMFDADALAALAAGQEQFRQMVSEQTAAAAARRGWSGLAVTKAAVRADSWQPVPVIRLISGRPFRMQ